MQLIVVAYIFLFPRLLCCQDFSIQGLLVCEHTINTIETFERGDRRGYLILALSPPAAHLLHYEHRKIHLLLAVLFPKFEIIG